MTLLFYVNYISFSQSMGNSLSTQQVESSARKYLSRRRLMISLTRYIFYTIYADQGTDKGKRDCWGHVRTFLMPCYYFDSVVKGRPRIQEFLIGSGQSLVQKGLLNFFVANYFPQRRPHVSQSVNAGRHWHSSYRFASRGKQIIGRYPKTITFLNPWGYVAFH